MPAELTAQQLDELRAIDSPTIANAIEYFTVRPRVAGYCGTGVRCLTPSVGTLKRIASALGTPAGQLIAPDAGTRTASKSGLITPDRREDRFC